MNDSSQIAYRVIDAFFRHRWLLLVTAFTVSGLAVGILCTRPRTYSATVYWRVLTDDTASLVGVAPSAHGYNSASLAQQNVNRFEDLMTDDQPGGFLAQ